MGFRGGFKGGKHGFKAWKHKAFSKSKWADKRGRDCDDDDDAGVSFAPRKWWKQDHDHKHFGFKKHWKKSWQRDDDEDRGFGKKYWKACKRRDDDRDDRDEDCDIDFDWKAPGCNKPNICEIPLEISDPCIYPELEPKNNAPEIVEPTETALTFSVLQGEVAKVSAIDMDPEDTLIFSITETAASEDADHFVIDANTGQILLNGAATTGGSADGDSTYEIEVQVTDGKDVDTILLELTYEQQIINQQGAPLGM